MEQNDNNFILFSGSPLSTTSNPSDSIDRFSLPPYNPNNSPRSAEELLKTLVNPIEFDLSEEHYLHPESYPESGPFFDLHRTKNVTALKGVSTNLICRVRRLGNHTVSHNFLTASSSCGPRLKPSLQKFLGCAIMNSQIQRNV